MSGTGLLGTVPIARRRRSGVDFELFGIGFNELKTAEPAHPLEAIAGRADPCRDVREGLAIEAAIDAMVLSAAEYRRVAVSEMRHAC